MLSDLVADVLLPFANFPVILWIGFIILLKFGLRYFLQTASLLSFNILVNAALKVAFKIPLSPYLHKVGYAFPSGHMQFATVFYIWLGLQIPSKFYRVITLILLPGVAVSMIHYGYHNLSEILAGFICGLLLVVIYQFVLYRFAKAVPWLLFSIGSILMIYNELRYQSIPHVYVWKAYGLLIFFIMMSKINEVRSSFKVLDFNKKY